MSIEENRVNYDSTVEESVLILHRKTDFISSHENWVNYIYRVEDIVFSSAQEKRVCYVYVGE